MWFHLRRCCGCIQVLFRASPNPFFWHIQIDFYEVWTTKNCMKCDFCKSDPSHIWTWVWNAIPVEFLQMCFSLYVLAAQSVLRHSHHDTQWWRQIQSDGSASERLWVNVYQSLLSPSLSGVMEELCTASLQCDCLEGEMMDYHFSCFHNGNPHHQRAQLLTPMSLPQQSMQKDWCCLDTQIPSDHLQITVWTVCLKDLIWETNLIFLQSEKKPKSTRSCAKMVPHLFWFIKKIWSYETVTDRNNLVRWRFFILWTKVKSSSVDLSFNLI